MIITFKNFLIYLIILIIACCWTWTIRTSAAIYSTKKNILIYSSPIRKKKNVIDKLPKKTKLNVISISGNWVKISHASKTGYILKKFVKKSKETPIKPVNPIGSSKMSIKVAQQKLVTKGYLNEDDITGIMTSTTKKGIKIFQIVNNLVISGKLDVSTRKKINSNNSKNKPIISMESWPPNNINSTFPRGGSATVIDIETGRKIKIKRLGGTNHLDIEPISKSDTKKLKSLYGKWTWNTRPVILMTSKHFYCGSINLMPHGSDSVKNNGMNGQICLHLKNSQGHASGVEGVNHQRDVEKVYDYWYS